MIYKFDETIPPQNGGRKRLGEKERRLVIRHGKN